MVKKNLSNKIDKTTIGIIVVSLALLVVVFTLVLRKCKREGFAILDISNASWVTRGKDGKDGSKGDTGEALKLTVEDINKVSEEVFKVLDRKKWPNGVYKYKNNPHPLSNLPVGTILMWNSDYVPQGWARCDGRNGTPDFRIRFPIGSGGILKTRAKGGLNTDINLNMVFNLRNSGNQSLEPKSGGYMPWVHWDSQRIPLPPYTGINFIMKLPLSAIDYKTGVPKENIKKDGTIDGAYWLDRKVPYWDDSSEDTKESSVMKFSNQGTSHYGAWGANYWIADNKAKTPLVFPFNAK